MYLSIKIFLTVLNKSNLDIVLLFFFFFYLTDE